MPLWLFVSLLKRRLAHISKRNSRKPLKTSSFEAQRSQTHRIIPKKRKLQRCESRLYIEMVLRRRRFASDVDFGDSFPVGVESRILPESASTAPLLAPPAVVACSTFLAELTHPSTILPQDGQNRENRFLVPSIGSFWQVCWLAGCQSIVSLTCSEAFTIPLPLFPRIIEWYTAVSALYRVFNPAKIYQNEGSDPTCLLSRTLYIISSIRALFYKPNNNPQRWDVVLLGEFILASCSGISHSVYRGLDGFSLFVCISSDIA